ncbi:hypothetical protein [Solidesulfovibrio magneticus]|uniref:Glycosyltransferase n=1 Tax=Solidesulfovibrio magneticus (strain ATCC 700980 / DSM 13731 / RS-1) TaxID=573370 RepID=C4XJF8_SOLM1|nr:hypothetical protein [Solidesulfovibrio magneticus]BAH76708.1 hypothetical protein DMR_32170 [Solidesulfovibrio magneticus RS-1]
MRIYLSGFGVKELEEYTRCVPQAKLNILLSYSGKDPDYKKFLEDKHDNINSVILDSGAFTANFSITPGDLPFSFEGYKAFCVRYKGSYDFAFNYDIDFEKESLSTNYNFLEILKDAGIPVVPVVHDYTGGEVDLYIKQKYQIISAGYSKNEKNKENIKNIAIKIYNAGCKAHALGVSSYDWCADAPIHYSDSSSWSKYPAYGFIPFWNPSVADENKTHVIKFNDRINSKRALHNYDNYGYRSELEEYLNKRLGYKYIDLLSPKSIRRRIVCIDYYVQLQDVLTKRHARLGFNTDV